MGRCLGRGSFWGESWLHQGEKHKAGAQAVSESAKTLKWLLTLIPAAPPSSFLDVLDALLSKTWCQSAGHYFWGKKSCSANQQRGVEQLFPRKQQCFNSETLPPKNQVLHMLLFSKKKKKKLDGKPGKTRDISSQVKQPMSSSEPQQSRTRSHSPNATRECSKAAPATSLPNFTV